MFSLRARIAAYSGLAFAGLVYSGLAFAGLVLVLLVTRPAADPLDNPAYDALVKAHQHRMAADSVALVAARQALTISLSRTDSTLIVYRTIRDSFPVAAPVTRAETVAVLDRLPRLVAAADSEHRACTALAQDCDAFRVRAESSLAGLTADRDLWRTIAETRKPSRWDGLKEWAIRLSIGYVAFKIGQAAR